jgi:hypothetical protein
MVGKYFQHQCNIQFNTAVECYCTFCFSYICPCAFSFSTGVCFRSIEYVEVESLIHDHQRLSAISSYYLFAEIV